MKVQSASLKRPRPARARTSLALALSLGDLESATACFARDGCLITADATAIHGRDRIRPVLAQLIARRAEIEVETSSAIEAGEVVLARERWRMRSGTAAGERIEQILNPTLVMHRIEGRWKLAIAAPWGWAERRP